jgi:lupus La protein
MDKFLLSKVGGSANNAVPLSLLHSFKRMRRFQPFEAIVKALNTDNNAEAVKIFEDKAMARSIYAKGFGNFGDEDSTTQLDIEAFFEPYGPIKAVRLRRTQDKTFKASVFVEFADEEKQKAFLELAEKPKWKGQELVVKSKKEYCDEKVADIKAGKVFASTGRGGRGGRGRGRGGRGRGGRGDRGDRDREDKRDWRERRDEDQKSGFKKDARGVPVVQATGEKRAREDESNGEHPAKKVDSKE